jgi:hypothetical protein
VETSSLATAARFLPDAPTQNRPPDSRLPPNADSARPHHRLHHGLICISSYQSRHRQNLISIFSASHERRTSTVKRDGHTLFSQAAKYIQQYSTIPHSAAESNTLLSYENDENSYELELM